MECRRHNSKAGIVDSPDMAVDITDSALHAGRSRHHIVADMGRIDTAVRPSMGRNRTEHRLAHSLHGFQTPYMPTTKLIKKSLSSASSRFLLDVVPLQKHQR